MVIVFILLAILLTALAFGISFTWTYWHGLAVAFIIWILSSIFKVTINKS